MLRSLKPLPSNLRGASHAINAQTREVSQKPARKPRRKCFRTLTIDFGEFGLQTLDRAWITNVQIEAARVAMTRHMKRKGKLWIRIFPDKSVTARPPETRMGKGKAIRSIGSLSSGRATSS